MAAKNTENSLPNLPAALLVAAWTAVLLIAFFAYRGSDVGQIGRLLGNSGGGPLFGLEGFRDSVAGALIALIILASWFGLGAFVLGFVRTEQRSEGHSHVLEIAASIALGAGLWSIIWFFLGLFGLYNVTAAIALTVAGLALAVYGLKRIREIGGESRTPEKASGVDYLLLGLIAIPVFLSLVGALAPPTAKDTLLYHFALSKTFVAQGSNAFVDGNIASYLALGGEMHNVWAMLLGGMANQRTAGAAAGAVNWLFLPILLAAVFGWARELDVSRRFSLIAVLIVAAIPTAYHVASSAYIDLELALYVTLAIYAVSRWWTSRENGWLILMAVFLGAALSMKLTTVFVLAAFALVIAFRSRNAKDSGRVLTFGMGAILLALVIASPWYLRTWKATGSPVFPFYMSIWKGEAPGWDVERSNLFQTMNSQYGGESKIALDYLIAPWNLSVRAQPEQAEYFDGVLGVAFLVGLPILIWALWKLDIPVEVKLGSAVAAIMFLFWLFSSQQLRYLLPIVPVLAIAIAISAERLFGRDNMTRSVAQLSLIAAAASAIFVSVAWFLQTAPIRVVLGGETKDAYLTRNIDYYPYYQYLNTETAADAKVWLIDMRRDTYNLDRPSVSDYLFEDWTLRSMVWSTSNTPELKARAASLGVQYILTRHDFLFDYDRSTLVDDKRPRGENEAKLKMAKELLLDQAKTVRSDDKFSLVKVF
jgi:hypothetical protein